MAKRRPATDPAVARQWLETAVATRDRSGCWDWPFGRNDQAGYGKIGTRLATHVALELDGRPRPGRLYALHSCDNPPCVSPAHLRWDTHAKNVKEMWERKGGHVWDDAARSSIPRKLDQRSVTEIRRRYVKGNRWHPGNAVGLAEEFGVDPSTISNVVRRRTWS